MLRPHSALAGLCALLGVAACGRERDKATDARQPNFSVYELDSKWRDASGRPRALSSMRGRPQVLALIYTSCTSVCPITVAIMQQVEARVGDRAGYLLVSLDPDRDSPARLAEFAKEHQLSARWTLLSGAEPDVRELAAVIGVQYRRVTSGQIDHTTSLTILDADGRVVAQHKDEHAGDEAVRTLMRMAPGAGSQ